MSVGVAWFPDFGHIVAGIFVHPLIYKIFTNFKSVVHFKIFAGTDVSDREMLQGGYF